MSAIKTPEEIATEVLRATVADDGIAALLNRSLVYRWVERAIEADRAQRVAVDPFDIANATAWRAFFTSKTARKMFTERSLASHIEIGIRDYIRATGIAPMADGEQGGTFEDGDRECSRCGDEVATLNNDDECDSCEHEARRSGWEPGQ